MVRPTRPPQPVAPRREYIPDSARPQTAEERTAAHLHHMKSRAGEQRVAQVEQAMVFWNEHLGLAPSHLVNSIYQLVDLHGFVSVLDAMATTQKLSTPRDGSREKVLRLRRILRNRRKAK